MELTAQDIREVRFGTTRMRAGYDMKEVDAFLDVIESTISAQSEQSQHLRDEADALRSQVQQLQVRLAGVQAELDECRVLCTPISEDGHTTVVTEVGSSADTATTAENPIIASDDQRVALVKVRDDVRRMLTDQLRIVDELTIESR